MSDISNDQSIGNSIDEDQTIIENPIEENHHRDDRQDKLDPLQEEIKRQEGRFKDGQILTFIRVRFPGNAKSFPFLMGKRRLNYGQKVVALSDRGVAVGYVNSFPYDVYYERSMLPIRSINKIATDEDLVKQREDYKRQKSFERICLDCIEKYKLDMNLTHVEFTQFGKKAVFYFTAPARVDFRELVKDLVNQLKLRIELRQISLRDRASAVGGIGPCGRELCCSSFLAKYGNVNIKMAKNQNLSLIYNKLNGVCGQLKCCLQYEDEVYTHKRDILPQEGDYIRTRNGDRGRVDKLHLLSEQFDMLTEYGAIRRYSIAQYDRHKYLPDTYNLPHFEHITDETANVIGLDENDAYKTRQFEKEIDQIKKSVPQYTTAIWNELFESAPKPIEADAEKLPESDTAPAEAVKSENTSRIYYENTSTDASTTEKSAEPVAQPVVQEERPRHHHNNHQNQRRHHHNKNFNNNNNKFHKKNNNQE